MEHSKRSSADGLIGSRELFDCFVLDDDEKPAAKKAKKPAAKAASESEGSDGEDGSEDDQE